MYVTIFIFALLFALFLFVTRDSEEQKHRTNRRIEQRRAFREYDYDPWRY